MKRRKKEKKDRKTRRPILFGLNTLGPEKGRGGKEGSRKEGVPLFLFALAAGDRREERKKKGQLTRSYSHPPA